MKALILAAGLGTRLRPITDSRPKSMVEVNGTPILFKQIDNLKRSNIHDITVIAGYKAEMMIEALNRAYPTVKIIVNNDYNKTNNMYSAYLAKDEFVNTEFILMNADVFYDEEIIKELIDTKYYNAIVVEEGLHNEENMKVVCTNGNITEISKAISENDAYGVSIDVYKFSRIGSSVFFNKIIEYIEGKKELNQWTEVALNDVLKEIKFTSCPLKGRWMEIDNHEDLRRAESIFK
jgi:choline kinase